VLSARAWLRKLNTLAIEGMHAGIMVFMGLVCFGLIMLGADSVCLRDSDYHSLHRFAAALRDRVMACVRGLRVPPMSVPVETMALEEETRVSA
jgi:hypothetical protein